MKKVIFTILLSYSLFFCEYGDENLTDRNLYNLDSTVFMYCKINSDIFYGKTFTSNGSYIDSLHSTGLIKAYFYPEKIELILTSRMMLTHPKTIAAASLRKDSSFYSLIDDQPFDLNLTTLTDTLIIGDFYGKFVNSNNVADTINISNGYLRIHPFIKDDFHLTLNIDNDFHDATMGYEQLPRNHQVIQAIDSTFQDSLIARIQIDVSTFSTDFIKDYYFTPYGKYLYVGLFITSKNSDYTFSYTGFSGSLKVNALDYIIEKGVSRERLSNFNFEVDARSIQDEIIKIIDGHFSSVGY